MPLKPFRTTPKSDVEWELFFRGQQIAPDDGTVTDDSFDVREPASVIGNATGSDAKPTDIIAAADGQPLIRRAGVLQFDAIALGDLPSSVATDVELAAGDAVVAGGAAAALAAHVAASDPHPTYLTQAEGDALYQPLAAVLSMLHTGAGTPEGVLTATVGHIYLRSNGGASTTLYVKESGTGNTGWVAK